jgi:hypothetical protein
VGKSQLFRYEDEKAVSSGLKRVLLVSIFLPVKKNGRV